MKQKVGTAQWDGIPRVVHILSDSAERIREAIATVDSAADLSARYIVVDERILVYPWRALVQPFPLEGCALVLVLSREVLTDQSFARLLVSSLRDSLMQPNFRLFLALANITRQEFDTLSSEPESACEWLKENIQLTENVSLG